MANPILTIILNHKDDEQEYSNTWKDGLPVSISTHAKVITQINEALANDPGTWIYIQSKSTPKRPRRIIARVRVAKVDQTGDGTFKVAFKDAEHQDHEPTGRSWSSSWYWAPRKVG